MQELQEDLQGNLHMGEVHRWEELTMEIQIEEEVVEMAVLEEDLGEVDQEVLGVQGDQVAQGDHPMTLMIGVQIPMHTGIHEMDGLQFEDFMEREVDQDQLDKTQHRSQNLTNKRTGST